LRKIFIALTSDRLVDIRDGEVTVVDKHLLSTRVWRMPLMTYEGVALRLRTSLSGTHQEAELVHPRSPAQHYFGDGRAYRAGGSSRALPRPRTTSPFRLPLIGHRRPVRGATD
jgi:hypothetical protein